VLRVSPSLSTMSNTPHGQTLPRDTLGAAFHGATALHQPMGGNGVALTLWRYVGTVGTSSTRTIAAYARLRTGLPQPLAGVGALGEGLLVAQCGGSLHSPADARGWRMITGSQHVTSERGRAHGPLSKSRVSAAMPRTRAQRLRETVAEDGWAELPDELLAMVLQLLQAAGRSEPQEGGFGFSQTTATVRLVCSGWKAVHDALVMRLVMSRQTTDEAVGMLVLRFPAVVSLEVKGEGWSVLTDEGMQAVSSLPALKFLDLTGCGAVTDAGMLAVSGLTLLTSLNLGWCKKVTDEGLRAVSSLPALTELDLGCLTQEGLRAVISSNRVLEGLGKSRCTTCTYREIPDGISLPLFRRQDKAEEQQRPAPSPSASSAHFSPAILL
jgi:hypothetical protein